MKIYTDKKLTNEVKILDLGIVEAGETRRFTFYLLNNSDAFLKDLAFSVEHKEVEIIEAPLILDNGAVGELILEWSPSVTLKAGLKAQLRIKGMELWG